MMPPVTDFKADEAQDKQEGSDADGRRILLRTITARLTMTPMGWRSGAGSKHYCGFYHNKSLLVFMEYNL